MTYNVTDNTDNVHDMTYNVTDNTENVTYATDDITDNIDNVHDMTYTVTDITDNVTYTTDRTDNDITDNIAEDTDDINEELADAVESFRVEVPFEPPVVIRERSLDDEPLPDEVMPDAPLRFELIESASQKGADLLVDSLGYSYNKRYVQVFLSIDGDCRNGHVHVRTEIVSQAKRDVESETGPGVGTINNANIARRTNYKRAALRPADPKDMDFVLDLDSIPQNFWRDDVEVDGRRHLLFSSDTQVNALRRAARWYVDGTFKCMRAPFNMLLTIHAFVKRADCSKQVPQMFALMSGRDTRDYTAVFESVRRFLAVNVVEGMVMDFEAAIWKAARQVFPNVI